LFADQAFDRLIKENFETVLDIGCGKTMPATKAFKKHGKKVTAVDFFDNPEITKGDYNQLRFDEQFDCVWASHVLEHQHNVQIFLQKIYHDCKEGGWVAITVPPRKDEIVGGHVSLWNPGLLVYNLVLAGFNCRECKIKMYDYNCSVIVQKQTAKLPPLIYDNGEIQLLQKFFPPFFRHSVNGMINEWNW